MFFEVLEPRRLYSVAFNSSTGLLTVTEGSANDLVRVGQSGNTLSIHEGTKITNYDLTKTKVKKLAIYGGAGNDSLLMSSNVAIPALLDGGAGNDSIDGGAGNDTITGDDGNDTLRGWGGNDSISGGNGNDNIDGGYGNDTMSGGAGSDRVDYSNRPENLTLKVGAGAVSGAAGEKDSINADIETIQSGSGNDLIVGTSAAQSIQGGAGNDTIIGNGGNDTVGGNTGNDTYDFLPTTTKQTIQVCEQFNEGNDTLDFSAIPNGTNVNVNLTSDHLANYSNTSIISFQAGEFANFENVNGGQGDDSIVGNGAPNKLNGNGGDDYLAGNGGNDSINGGAGDDTMDGGPGADDLVGGPGSDTADYSTRTDNLIITADNIANDGATGEGDNVHSDVETILGGAGMDSITGAAGVNSYLSGGAGTGSNTLIGSTGDDTLVASDNGDSLIGNGGSDFIQGGAGNDTIQTGASNDPAATGTSTGNATVFGGDGNDSIIGGLGDDCIMGEAGNDTIHGGQGNDSLDGGDDDDVIFGDAGNANTLLGGDGDDTISYQVGDNVQGGAGADLITSAGFADPGTGVIANVIVSHPLPVSSFSATNLAVTITPADTTNDDGDDIPDPNADTSTDDPGPGSFLDGGSGNDTIIGTVNDDTINGDDGDDSLMGGDGNDIVNGGTGFNTVDGGDGDDTLSGAGGDQTSGTVMPMALLSSADDDGPVVNNFFEGGNGNDVILNANGVFDIVDGGPGINLSEDDPVGGDNPQNTQVQDPNPDDEVDTGDGGDTGVSSAPAGPLASTFNGSNLIGQPSALIAQPLVVSTGTAVMNGSVLVINHFSDTAADKIVITQSGATLKVSETVGTATAATSTFPAAGVTQIQVVTGIGNDYISAIGITSPIPLNANGEFGNDTLIGGPGNDTLIGLAGNDYIQGQGGDDSLEGDAGNDSLYGGAGTDYLNGGSTGSFTTFGAAAGGGTDGSDLMDGGAGNDYGDYRWRSDNLTVFLDGKAHSGAAGENDTVMNTVENILGGAGNDTLVGSNLANYLSGGAGNDTIFGNGGSDALVGGTGIDNTYGGTAYTFFYLSGDSTGDGFNQGATSFLQLDTAPADIPVPKINAPT